MKKFCPDPSIPDATARPFAAFCGDAGTAAPLIAVARGAAPAGTSGLVAGLKTGAVVGFLMWFSVDFTLYGVQNVSNLTRTIVDPLLEVIHGGIGGAVVGLVVGKMKPAL